LQPERSKEAHVMKINLGKRNLDNLFIILLSKFISVIFPRK